MRKKRMKIETYLFIAGGLISMAGVQAQIVSAAEDSADYAARHDTASFAPMNNLRGIHI